MLIYVAPEPAVFWREVSRLPRKGGQDSTKATNPENPRANPARLDQYGQNMPEMAEHALENTFRAAHSRQTPFVPDPGKRRRKD